MSALSVYLLVGVIYGALNLVAALWMDERFHERADRLVHVGWVIGAVLVVPIWPLSLAMAIARIARR